MPTPAPLLLPLQQSSEYAATLRLLGREVLCVRTEVPLRLVRRRFGPIPVTYLPRGALACADRKSLVRALPLCHLRLIIPESPEDAGRLRRAIPVLTPQYVAEWALPPEGVPALWQGLHGKWRNRLRRAMEAQAEVAIRPFDPLRHAPLLAREAAQRQQRRYRALPSSFVAAFARANPGQTRMIEARQDGQVIAFVLLLLHPPVATYLIGWTGAAGRDIHAHNRLLWEAACWLSAEGFQRFDLGGVETDANPSLARFKLGTGATPRPLGPTLVLPPGLPA